MIVSSEKETEDLNQSLGLDLNLDPEQKDVGVPQRDLQKADLEIDTGIDNLPEDIIDK